MSKSHFPVYQLEWSKSYARTHRWKEEVELLKEEMRRTLKFLEWKSSSWVSKASTFDPSLLTAFTEGLNAYAFRQADVFMSLRDHFLSLWQGLKVLERTPDYPAPISVHIEEVMQGVEGGDCEPR